MTEPSEDIVNRVAELRTLLAREPSNVRRQFYLMNGLMREMIETDQSKWPADAWDFTQDWLERHEREDIVAAVFDTEEVGEHEWGRYHPTGERRTHRPLSHDPIRGNYGGDGCGAAKEDPVQARAF